MSGFPRFADRLVNPSQRGTPVGNGSHRADILWAQAEVVEHSSTHRCRLVSYGKDSPDGNNEMFAAWKAQSYGGRERIVLQDNPMRGSAWSSRFRLTLDGGRRHDLLILSDYGSCTTVGEELGRHSMHVLDRVKGGNTRPRPARLRPRVQ